MPEAIPDLPTNSQPTLSLLLTVIFLGAVSTVIAELLNYYLVYSKDDYKSLVSNIKVQNKKLDKVNETMTSANKAHEKKKHQIEESVKQMNTELSMKKFKSTFLIGLLSILTIGYFSSYFAGRVVAKLPFTPFGIIQGITHRGLEGTDYTEGGFLLIYILTGIVLRSNVQKMFGFEGPTVHANPFAMPSK